MNSFDFMLLNLSPVGVYSLSERSNTYCELKAMSAGIELVRELCGELLRECFYSTAEGYGLTLAEELLGKLWENRSPESRRAMLIARGSITSADFTPSGIKKLFDALGVSARVQENPAERSLVIHVGDEGFSQGDKNYIKSQLVSMLPLDVKAEIFFSQMSWSTIEETQATFGEMEGNNYTWEYIDSM